MCFMDRWILKEFRSGCLEIHTNTWELAKIFGIGVFKKMLRQSDIFRKNSSVFRYFVTPAHKLTMSNSSQIPLVYMKSNEWLISCFIWSVTLKQNKYRNTMETDLTPEIEILMSEIDLKHAILSVLVKHRIKTKLLQS